jgi:hypothetical protein
MAKTPSRARPLKNDTSHIMSDAILVLNAGSSSIKFSLFEGHSRPGPKSLICDGECGGGPRWKRWGDRTDIPAINQKNLCDHPFQSEERRWKKLLIPHYHELA